MEALAYVYSGMWVADCPRGCNNTEILHRTTEYHCTYCSFSTDHVVWPENKEQIDAVLGLRPIPHNRNWYPKDHPVAVRFRIPHGQSVADLKQENLDHGVPTT